MNLSIAWISSYSDFSNSKSATLTREMMFDSVDGLSIDLFCPERNIQEIRLPNNTAVFHIHQLPIQNKKKQYDHLIYNLEDTIHSNLIYFYLKQYLGVVILHDAHLFSSTLQNLEHGSNPKEISNIFSSYNPESDSRISELMLLKKNMQIFSRFYPFGTLDIPKNIPLMCFDPHVYDYCKSLYEKVVFIDDICSYESISLDMSQNMKVIVEVDGINTLSSLQLANKLSVLDANKETINFLALANIDKSSCTFEFERINSYKDINLSDVQAYLNLSQRHYKGPTSAALQASFHSIPVFNLNFELDYQSLEEKIISAISGHKHLKVDTRHFMTQVLQKLESCSEDFGSLPTVQTTQASIVNKLYENRLRAHKEFLPLLPIDQVHHFYEELLE